MRWRRRSSLCSDRPPRCLIIRELRYLLEMPERIINAIRSTFFLLGILNYIVSSSGGNYCIEGLILPDRHPYIFRVSPAVGAVPCSGNINVTPLAFGWERFGIIPKSPVAPVPWVGEIFHQTAAVWILGIIHGFTTAQKRCWQVPNPYRAKGMMAHKN